MKKVELLAPAGSLESLYAAVNAGADAVYLGGNKFSARAYASNFDEENMIQAVEYCHLYNVKVYAAVNTLIKENEMTEAIEYIGFLYKIGVDAVIVQDLGLIYLIKKYYPKFEIHASTQMTIHNVQGAKFINDLGVKRIVLSRELSLEEIRYISKDLRIETEVFIHGALCVCYSGQCLMSSMIGGRSGNRGRCAQPCRLPYTLIDDKNSNFYKGYILSTKDICTLDCIKDIINTGTSSLKIEGRMKRPEYVAGVVDIYRNAIDSIYKNGEVDSKYIKQSLNILKQLFNREGFSKAYLYGNVGKDMMAYNFPKNTGVRIGKVDANNFIKLEEDISINDGIRNENKGFTISKILNSDKKQVKNAFKGQRVRIIPSIYKTNDILYKTLDINLMSKYSKYYKDKFYKRINIPLKVKFKLGDNIRLSTVYNGVEINVEGEEIQRAIKSPITKVKLEGYLKETKNTPFDFETIEYECFDEGFMPVSNIKSARRRLIDNIYACCKNNREIQNCNLKNEYNNSKTEYNKNLPKNLICVNSVSQFKAARDMGFNDIAIDIFNKNSKLEQFLNEGVYLKIPNILKENFDYVCKVIDENISSIKGIVTSNLGIISKYRKRILIIGDYKLNIFNKASLRFYGKYVDMCCISVELNDNEINQLLKNNNVPAQILIYGKVELMVSEYCLIGSTIGDKSSNSICKSPCKNKNFYIKDRKNAVFPVITDRFCRSHIYNSVSTNLIPYINLVKKLNVNSYRFDFINENYDETLKILKAFKYGYWDYSFENYTRGHFKRGVE